MLAWTTMAAFGMVLARHYRSALGSKCLGQSICYRPQRSCGKVMFSQMCVKNYVHRGVCAWGGGVHGGEGGCVWQGGMHGRRGGVHGRRGMCGRRVCVTGGVHGGGVHGWGVHGGGAWWW